MKVLFISLSLLVALNALACDGSGNTEDKEEEKDKLSLNLIMRSFQMKISN